MKLVAPTTATATANEPLAPSPRLRRQVIAAIGLAVALLAWSAGSFVLQQLTSWGVHAREAVGAAILVSAAGVAVWAARSTSGRRSVLWTAVAAANACWLVAEVTGAIRGEHASGLGRPLTQWAAVAAYALLLAGLAIWLSASSWYGRVATVLDGVLVVLAAGTIWSIYVMHSAHWYSKHLPPFLVFTLATSTFALGVTAFPTLRRPTWATFLALGVGLGAAADVLRTEFPHVSSIFAVALTHGRGIFLLVAAAVAVFDGPGYRPGERQATRVRFAVGMVALATTVGAAVSTYWRSQHHGTVLVLVVGAAIGTLVLRLVLHAAKKHRDTERLVAALREQERLAVVDSLTGLYNRRFFDAALALEVERTQRSGGRIGLLVIDLDHFKDVNDVHGHLVGDEILREVGKRLMRAIRTGDIVARHGGEEFVVLLPGGGPDQLAEIGERCRHSIGDGAIAVNGGKLSVTASVGGASWPGDGQSVRQVFEAADSALYRAKQNGRDRVELATRGAGPAPEATRPPQPERRARTEEPAAEHAAAKRPQSTRPSECSPRHMATWAALTARALGMDDEAQRRCAVAARFHDVGKAVIPKEVLHKRGPLSAAEWELLHEHPAFGARLVSLIPQFATAAQVILEHHERFDGRGYPRGMQREEISREGHIVGLCDAWVAMRTGRPYASPKTESEARAELLAARGTQFDPAVVETFLMFDESAVAEVGVNLALDPLLV
jgi:diguanylate cyclase (GGDEF)-like protein